MRCPKYKKCKLYDSLSYTCNENGGEYYEGRDAGCLREENKPKIPIMLVLATIFLLVCLMIGGVSAVECGAVPTQPCAISSSTTFDGLPHNLNGTDAIPIIQINNHNLILDCNGSIIYGNFSGNESLGSPSTRAIGDASVRQNVTIKNCIIQNYVFGIRVSNQVNWTFINNTISNVRTGIFALINDSRIINNSISNIYAYGIYINGKSYNNLIDSNYFYNTSQTFVYSGNENGGASFLNISNNYMNFSTFYGSFSVMIKLSNISNFNIFNNNMYNATGMSMIGLNNYINGSIYNNYLNYNDRGIDLQDSGLNLEVYNNTINNSFLHTDVYDVAIASQGLRGSKTIRHNNLNIYNNTLINFGCIGIKLRDVNGYIIKNNILFQDLSYLLSQNYNCNNEPMTGIMIEQAYKGFVPSGSISGDNYTITQNHTSNNGTVTGNLFSGVNVLLRTQGATNFTTDLDSSNSWIKYFRNIWSFGDEIMYISNYYQNVSRLYTQSNYVIGFQSGATGRFTFNISFIREQYDYFININTSSRDLIVFNLTSALLTNSTSLCNGSTGLVTGDVNITLNPNEACWVLDDFNVTEGISREYSPIWFSSSTATSKHVASNLTDTINTTVVLSVNSCTYIGKITYTSNSGNTTREYNHGDYTCSNNKVTLLNIPIEPATSSNEFTINYNQGLQSTCSESTSTFSGASGIVGMILTIVFISVVLGAFLLSFSGIIDMDFNVKEIDWKMLVTGVIVVGVTFLLLATMVYLIGDKVCVAFGA